MANLLPHNRQVDAWRAYRARFIIVGSCIALVCAAIALCALLPSLIILNSRESALLKKAASPLSADQMTQDRAAIARLQYVVEQVRPIIAATTTPPHRVIVSALSVRPVGVHLRHMRLIPGPNGSLVFDGSSDTGDLLNTYRIALSNDSRFNSVAVPVDSLVGTEPRSFTMTIKGAF